MNKIDMLYQFLELNGIKPNLSKEEAYKVKKCPNCDNEKVYPLALCDLSELNNVDLSWGIMNLSKAKIYMTCLGCLKEFEKKNSSFEIFYTEPAKYVLAPPSIGNANFFFGVQTINGDPRYRGVITRDMFIFSEDSEIYKEIKENPLKMASQYYLDYQLLRNKKDNLEALHKKELEKKTNWTIFITAIVVGGIMLLFNPPF